MNVNSDKLRLFYISTFLSRTIFTPLYTCPSDSFKSFKYSANNSGDKHSPSQFPLLLEKLFDRQLY